jgi:Xaa-Pro aminopeptidase
MKLEFTTEEYQKRYTRIVGLMAENEIDAIMVTAEPNVNYYSGFRSFNPWWTYTRPYILIIPKDHEPVLLVQGFHRFDVALDSWIKDVRGYAPLTGVPADQVADLFKELGLMGKRIGLELGYEQRICMPYNDFEKLKEALKPCIFLDASEIIWKQRMIKSEEEIAAHRRACEIGDKVFAAIFAETHEGMTEKEVAKIAGKTIANEGGDPGFIIALSGEGNYERVAGNPTNRILQKGDLMWIDLGVIANGYYSDYCRAGVVGGPTPEQNRLQDVVVDLTMKTAKCIHPGMKASELAKNCIKIAAGLGIDLSFDCGRLGHGIGINSTEPPHIAIYDETVLEPGMVFTLEPGLITAHGTFIAEENLVLRPDGIELLTTTSRELRSI